ncbi:MucR family transcriptional regulator [Pseudaminobacter soli (ex Zhang et al. 2022)]|uniref:MucR family transcriptional regulator n=1 Tax=Pseudaminobacter soli (ex Zhang et al. 2022) TaxID=2831468 RepID=UPI003080E097
MNDEQSSRLELIASIVSAYVSNNSVPMAHIGELVQTIHETLLRLESDTSSESQPLVPAVPIKKSVTSDYIISLEDGRRFRSLKRHLSAQYGMSPEQYRAKWNLPPDYPMVAPSYASARSALAKSIGLGRKPTTGEGSPGRPRTGRRGRTKKHAE